MITLQNTEMYKNEMKEGLSVIMFSADWCPDCRVIEPILPEIESTFSSFSFYYADRDLFIDLCSELEVYGIPSFIAYLNGQEIDRFVSRDRKTKNEIEQFLQGALDKSKGS